MPLAGVLAVVRVRPSVRPSVQNRPVFLNECRRTMDHGRAYTGQPNIYGGQSQISGVLRAPFD